MSDKIERLFSCDPSNLRILFDWLSKQKLKQKLKVNKQHFENYHNNLKCELIR